MSGRIFLGSGRRQFTLLVRPPPVGYHAVADISRIAEGCSPAGPDIGAPSTTLRSIPGQVIGARAWMAGRQISGDALLDDCLSDLRIRRLG
jgi:hypothetical protein